MRIEYANRMIERLCTDDEAAIRAYGQQMSERLRQRVRQLSRAENVMQMVRLKIGRCHPLKGNRKGQYALDLTHPYRLIFEQHGGAVRIALIIEIVDYH